MFEYNNKEFMLEVFETLESQGKKRIAVEDIEKLLPEETPNRKLISARILRQLIDHRYLAANFMNGGYALLSADGRIHRSEENLRCFDILTLLSLDNMIETSFDEIVEDISLQDDIPACFTEKCSLSQMTKKGKNVDNIRKAVYEALERLIYAGYVVEESEGDFYANFDVGDYGKVFELAEDRCLVCIKFEKYMKKNRYLDDKNEDDDEDDLDFDDEKDIDDLLRDLESLKKEMESLDLFGGMDESKKEDTIKAKPSLEVDILQRLRDKYNNK